MLCITRPRFRKWNCIKFLKLFMFILLSLFYCEYLHYYIVLYKCKWPDIEIRNSNNGNPLHAIIIADTHLLGSRNGHWFDKLRREWQMYRSFQSAIGIHNPEVIIFLGDLFDEGKWCSEEEFKQYVIRFQHLFYVPHSTEVLIAAGNHDMGFHYSINPYLTNRFEKAFKCPNVYLKLIRNVTFVAINSMAMHGDDCFLCKPARLAIESISDKLRCAQGLKKDCIEISDGLSTYSQPIILQHYPMYRKSDASCSEADEAPPDEKEIYFREKWECLSKESSDMLLRELQPRLVLSGHTHHGCQTIHNFTIRNLSHSEKISTLEYTVSSFSWRNKKNPTFAMLTASKDDYAIYKCHMPNENTVDFIYLILGIIFILYLLKRKIRVGNTLYSQCKKKL